MAITHAALIEGRVYGVGDSEDAAIADAEQGSGASAEWEVVEVSPALAAAWQEDAVMHPYRMLGGQLVTIEEAEAAAAVKEAADAAREDAIQAAMGATDDPDERRDMLLAMWDALQRGHPAVCLSKRRGAICWAPGVPLLHDGTAESGGRLARYPRSAAEEMAANLGLDYWQRKQQRRQAEETRDRRDRLSTIGRLLYGDEWVSPIARALDVSLRTAQRWAASEVDVPAGVTLDLDRILLRDGPDKLSKLQSDCEALGRLLQMAEERTSK